MNWQSFLDNFALISGQFNNMMKVIKSDRIPPYKNRIVLPLLLSPDQDDELLKVTEGRVAAFNHDLCPDYLRTKPIPEIELNEKKINDKLSKLTPDSASKLIANSNKIVNKLLDIIKNQRENWANDSLQNVTSINQTSSQLDTNSMIAAISSGKGIIEPLEPIAKSAPAIQQPQSNQPPRSKVPGIKTNIKAGAPSAR